MTALRLKAWRIALKFFGKAFCFMVNALNNNIPIDAHNLINKAIMRLPTVTADRLAHHDSSKYTHSFTQFVDDRLNWP